MRLPSMPSMTEMKVMGQQAYQWTAGQVKSLPSAVSYVMNNKMYVLRSNPYVRTSTLIAANVVFTKLNLYIISNFRNFKAVQWINENVVSDKIDLFRNWHKFRLSV